MTQANTDGEEAFIALQIRASALRRLLGRQALQVEELRNLDRPTRQLVHQLLLDTLGNSSP